MFQAKLDAALRVREKAHTRAGDAIGAARRGLPMVEVDSTAGLDGPVTLLDVFEGRRQLIAYYFMWDNGQPAAEQCEGCALYTTQIGELSYLHSRDVTYTTLCQGPYEESVRYRDFMGWTMPWYSAQASLETLLAGRRIRMFHLVCYLRQGDRVFETYWTNGRGVEPMGNGYAPLLDLTVSGRQESWEHSPAGWPQRSDPARTRTARTRTGRPTDRAAGRRSPNGPAYEPAAPTTSQPTRNTELTQPLPDLETTPVRPPVLCRFREVYRADNARARRRRAARRRRGASRPLGREVP